MQETRLGNVYINLFVIFCFEGYVPEKLRNRGSPMNILNLFEIILQGQCGDSGYIRPTQGCMTYINMGIDTSMWT